MSIVPTSLNLRKARAHHILNKRTDLDPEETRDAVALIFGLRGVTILDADENYDPMNRLGQRYRRLELERIDPFLLHECAARVHPDWFQLPFALMQQAKPRPQPAA